jgi:hypothetical protein
MDRPNLQRLLIALLPEFNRKGYFQEAMGYDCVDEPAHINGYMGSDPEAFAIIRLRKPSLWPVSFDLDYSEEDLFDIFEFVFDNISKPVDGRQHTFSNCGWHYSTFDKSASREAFRESANALLRDYGEGWTLSESGEILRVGPEDLAPLLDTKLPPADEKNVAARVASAVLRYRRHSSSAEEQREAVRSLADVLEFLRVEAKVVLTRQDESDLFNLANSFGLRHHDRNQKTDYDLAIWLPWMFYYYLATIHALLSILQREGVSPGPMPFDMSPQSIERAK